MKNLNPGITRTVAWLREHGFNTQDSGDGATHDFECDQPIPYVHMMVKDPILLVGTVRKLERLLAERGVSLQPMNEAGTAPAIEASWNPRDGFAIVTLWNVADADLFQSS